MKDERLYMTYPIDIHRHPKLTRLSVDAKWAFVEMNGEARIADNDGVFAAAEAEFMWSPEILAELVGSHPTRPLVVHEDGQYRIREFAKHQQTSAEREALRAKRVEAGRKGGLAKSQASAKHALSPTEQTQAQSESEIPLTDVNHLPASVTEVDARANNTDNLLETLRIQALVDAERLGIRDLPEVRSWLEKATTLTFTMGDAVELARDILSRAKGDVQDADRYVIGTCRKSPSRVREYANARQVGVA